MNNETKSYKIMNKKQRDRKNRKRAIKVGELKMRDETIRYVDVQFLMKVGGKVFGSKRFHYRRGRSTTASDLEQLAQIILRWEKTVDFSNTHADYFIREVEGRIANRSGLTADDIIRKYWVNYRETVEQDFERDNKGRPDHWLYKNENDCLRTSAGVCLDSFFHEPLPVKLAVLYGIYRIGYESDGFEGMRQEIEQIPQRIKDLVDGMIAESKRKEDEI